VLSGDTVILREKPRGGPPQEYSVSFAFIQAPKIARKVPPKENGEEAKFIPDDPLAWEAREFLRKKLIGKEVVYKFEYSVSLSGTKSRECGFISHDGEDIGELMVSEGYATVIRRKANENNEYYNNLIKLEEEAASKPKKESKKRVVKYDVDDPTEIERKTFRGIVEDVIDGSTLRIGLLLDPVYQYITLILAGIKCPVVSDNIGVQAKFFTESKLLNKDVEVKVEQVFSESQKNKFYGSVLIGPNNIAEFLLKEGMARLMSNSLSSSVNPSALRNAEKEAKSKRLRLFKDYVEAKSPKSVTYEVVEIINGDALRVRNLQTNDVKKIFLSSIRPPPKPDNLNDKLKPLYDVPLMFEAREFLRKRLIGKRVQVTTDYIQPPLKSETGKPDLAEKECCTVLLNDTINIAEALVSKGLATVVKHRDNDDKRSSQYDALLDAEMKAQKTKRGVHGSTTPLRVVDLSNDVHKAKHYFDFLVRAGSSSKLEAVVEYVYSSSRVKLFVPKENCLLNLILAGITAPKATDPEGNEGLNFIRSLIHQRDVEITIESMDKLGNYIGYLFLDNKNMSLELLRSGYAQVRDAKGNQFVAAEEEAKSKKLGLWKNYVENEVKPEEEEIVNESEKEVTRIEVVITHVCPQMSSIFAQLTENEALLDELLTELREELTAKPPLPGSFQIKKGEICAAKYSADGQWYRAKVEKNLGNNTVSVIFIDYGNRDNVSTKDLAPLPSSKFGLQPGNPSPAKEYGLAFVTLPTSDLDAIQEAREAFMADTSDKRLKLKKEYKDPTTGMEYVTLLNDKNEDVVLDLVKEGFFVLDVKGRREKRLEKIIAAYKEAQEAAKRKRLNIWRYGDFTEDDAIEFGLGK
ncbi:staphylococcal nuclease domain-containing protein 1-like protein, partial [Dinothrombium tinctorium]